MKAISYEILQATEEHVAALPEIEHAAAQLFSTDDLPQHLKEAAPSESFFLPALRADLLWVVIQKEEECPVGFLMAEVVDGRFHVKEMDIHPGHGRKGLGTRLLHHCMKVAVERGFQEASLTTFSHVLWNAPFYKRSGFRAVDVSDLTDGLRALLKEESLRGLKNRIAMVALL